MLSKSKGHKTRKNRRKKDVKQMRRQWLGRFLTGIKLIGIAVSLMAVSAMFMYGYAAVTRSEYFRAERIRVSGNQRVSEEQILSQAGVDIGNNLLALNLRLVRKQLLAHPWIADARVSREIPETITIQVTENEPLAQVDLGRRFLINTEGRIFKEVQGEDLEGLPVINGVAYNDISLGEDELTPVMASVVDLLAICRSKSAVIPYGRIASLQMDREMGITVSLKDGRQMIKLGFDGFEAKLKRFERLRPVLEGNQEWSAFQIVDLNNPDRIVVRLGASARKGA